MGATHVPVELRRQIVQRAGQRCEYCLIPESTTFLPHEMDHIIAVKHGGATEEFNLALACTLCNGHKGSDLASIDPVTGLLTPLFHPRRDSWIEHFQLIDGRIDGVTPVGRVTAQLLQLNTLDRTDERKIHQAAGLLRT